MNTNGSFAKSEALFTQAQKQMPGGVSSPVRAFRHVGGTPIYFKSGKGSSVIDEDGNKYVDFCLGWGPLILGHAHPAVVEAVTRTAQDGLTFGTCHRNEVALSELVLEAFPSEHLVRFVVSGTEAVLTALRLARAHTQRPLILKFSGCYHGHVDALLVKAGSGLVTQGLADSEGVTVHTASDTLVLPLGNEEALQAAFAKHGSQIAAAIVEPLPANNGLLLQKKEWLKRLRQLTHDHGSLLIFDEVISGFRFGFHGYGKMMEIVPDLTTLGKIVGGGLPVGAIVAPTKILSRLAPLGAVYQAGTMAGNPVALSAGVATLKELKGGQPYRTLNTLEQHFDKCVKESAGGPQWLRVGSVFWPYFDRSTAIPNRAEDISKTAIEHFKAAYRKWLSAGVYLPPSAYEVGFLSAAHTTADVDLLMKTLRETSHASS